jgi:hypothetical protein
VRGSGNVEAGMAAETSHARTRIWNCEGLLAGIG